VRIDARNFELSW